MIDVLAVDDSAVIREAMKLVFADPQLFHIRTAPDAAVARSRIAGQRPDVILLDLEMPGEHGLVLLRDLVKTTRIPVVICSAVPSGSVEARAALKSGAVDFVAKPKLQSGRLCAEAAQLVVDAVQAAAQLGRRRREGSAPEPARAPVEPRFDRPRAIVVGVSTGGPDALARLAPHFLATSPGTVIVQHMPEGYTRALVESLGELVPRGVSVREARDGDLVEPGGILIAPGGRHTSVEAHGITLQTRVFDDALVSRHRPSVDVLFESAAHALGNRGLGLIMTGMGDDGVRGLKRMAEAGARTIAQDRASSAVWGMPGAAVEAGAATLTLSLAQLATLWDY
ncbi:MAG TPA: chemotaxis-specific protein-glutamate methyltransferase CheB [Kofleriaceae bacterium]|nr:chemotaxis-specific protein-glutamate methyltransferase CheB [Kofleriaceae bacterium]